MYSTADTQVSEKPHQKNQQSLDKVKKCILINHNYEINEAYFLFNYYKLNWINTLGFIIFKKLSLCKFQLGTHKGTRKGQGRGVLLCEAGHSRYLRTSLTKGFKDLDIKETSAKAITIACARLHNTFLLHIMLNWIIISSQKILVYRSLLTYERLIH